MFFWHIISPQFTIANLVLLFKQKHSVCACHFPHTIATEIHTKLIQKTIFPVMKSVSIYLSTIGLRYLLEERSGPHPKVGVQRPRAPEEEVPKLGGGEVPFSWFNDWFPCGFGMLVSSSMRLDASLPLCFSLRRFVVVARGGEREGRRRGRKRGPAKQSVIQSVSHVLQPMLSSLGLLCVFDGNPLASCNAPAIFRYQVPAGVSYPFCGLDWVAATVGLWSRGGSGGQRRGGGGGRQSVS